MKGKLSTPYIVSIGLIVVGLLLCCWGAYVPPKGVVDGSLLEVFGMAILAAGLLLGIETAQMAILKGTDATVKVGDKVEVHIESPDNENEN